MKDLLKKIEKTEALQKSLYALMAEPDFYQTDPKEIIRVKAQADAYAVELTRMYGRWEQLEKQTERGTNGNPE